VLPPGGASSRSIQLTLGSVRRGHSSGAALRSGGESPDDQPGGSDEQARRLRQQVPDHPHGAAQRHLANDPPHRWRLLALGLHPARRVARGVLRRRRRPREPRRDHHRHGRRVLRASGESGHFVLPDSSVDRADRPHSLGGPPPLDEAARDRGACDQRSQRAGLASFRDPAVVRYRPRRRYRAVSGFGASRPTWCRATACTSSIPCSWA
jgi:hypothetical protein